VTGVQTCALPIFRSRDEIGAMAASFNRMQNEIVHAVDSLGDAREGLRTATEGFARLSRQNELLLTSTEESIIGLDRDGKVAFLNPASIRLLGYTAEELTGRDLHETVHHHHADGSDYARDECRIVQTLRGGQAASIAVDDVVWHKDGSQIPVRSSASPLIEEGAVAGLVLVLSDMSQQRQLETELRQAQKMEAVGQLAGGIAHDFNNLLTVISGYASFALQRVGEGDPGMQADLGEIQRAAERAASLTQQLLAFSRRETREVRVLDLNVIVEETSTLLGRLLGEEIQIETRLAGDLGRTKADEGQLEQVLVNLAVNARDAMPTGGVLTIETANVTVDDSWTLDHVGANPGSYVMLAVSDTGAGMDAATNAQIFEPFFTTKEPGKGTGLGLSTVYGIVKQSDGHIWSESALGEGTTFQIYLPRTIQELELVQPAVAPASEAGGQERILLVEDEPVVRALVCEMLEQSGYAVCAIPDALEALQLCESGKKFDLLVTDIVMPKMRGPELAERLANVCPELRVLYISGYSHDASGDVLTEGKAFLQKPFALADLTQKVRAVLDAPAPFPEAEPVAGAAA
jgi:two-component system cell cycle sensor histidine kinase/response regulator CckA